MDNPISRWTVAACSCAFVVAWSSGFLVAKIGCTNASPFTLLLWRFLTVAVALSAVAIVLRVHRGARRSGADQFRTSADLRNQLLVGLLGQFGYTAFVYFGIFRGVAAGTTALVDAIQPIAVATLVGPVLGLAVRVPQWLGLLIGTVGTAIVVYSQSRDLHLDTISLLCPLAAMACLIAATLADRRRPSALPIATVLRVHAWVSTAALLIVCAATRALVPPADPAFWAAVAVAAVGPTLAGYGLYWLLLRRIGVTALNGLMFLVAPSTAVAGTLLFGELFTWFTLCGFGLCGAGVALVLTFDRGALPVDRTQPIEHGITASPRVATTQSGGVLSSAKLRSPASSQVPSNSAKREKGMLR